MSSVVLLLSLTIRGKRPPTSMISIDVNSTFQFVGVFIKWPVTPEQQIAGYSLIFHLSRCTTSYYVHMYRGLGIYDVKGSVPVLFCKLHSVGRGGEKGGMQISKQSTQNL